MRPLPDLPKGVAPPFQSGSDYGTPPICGSKGDSNGVPLAFVIEVLNAVYLPGGLRDRVEAANSWHRLKPADQWHEDDGPVLWWRVPIEEPPYCGTPLDALFPPGYYTHFSRLPRIIFPDL